MAPRLSRSSITTAEATIQRLARWSAQCRTALGLSQEKAATAAGISQGGVSRLESGKCLNIPLVSYLVLARYYTGVGLASGIELTDPALLLRDPERIAHGLDPTHYAILQLLTEATPTQQKLLLEIVRAVVRPQEGADEAVQSVS